MTPREHMAMDVAGQQWRYPAAREAHVRELLGMSEARYWQVVNGLIDRGDVEAAYPALVRRLRRVREARRQSRSISPA